MNVTIDRNANKKDLKRTPKEIPGVTFFCFKALTKLQQITKWNGMR